MNENPVKEQKKARFVKFDMDGSNELIDTRNDLAKTSLNKAASRVSQQKIKRLTIDPIQEEALIDKELEQIQNYEIETTEFGDSSCISRGVLSPDDSIFAISGWSGECNLYSLSNNPKEPQIITQLLGHHYQVYDIIFHPLFGQNSLDENSVNLATCGADCTIKLWTYDPELPVQNY